MALDGTIALDPDFALAHAARARQHFMQAEPELARERAAVAIEVAARRGDARERSHVAVMADAVSGRPREALAGALVHLETWPRDAMILAMPLGAFGLMAFSGMADHDQARADLCARHAGQYEADDWWFLTNHGWSLVENGEVARGRAMTEHGLALRPANANAAHAHLHSLFEAGEGEAAEALVEAWLPTYDRAGMLHGHIAWHGALSALERGDVERALAVYGDHVRPSASLGLPLNVVTDAASFLWRLDAYGHGAARDLWDEAQAYAAPQFPEASLAFADVHMALLAAMAGDRAAVEARTAALERRIETGRSPAGAVVPILCRAALAFADEDYAACARLLEPLAHEVVRIGGSGAQRQMFEDMLTLSLIRAGEPAKAAARLDARLHRRPSPRDAAWRAELRVGS